ncbi:Tyrosine recombinase XerC [Planctomycetes bacterium LzC2]|uniref:Tyrosine recombinase XerC n=2 Tax=Alienimonas chondri TaxID=2681879 RepID=A0ABX1VDP0_9PLAN|nr:Tyrosine recombinase XerC [Alienimonas chondri]
MPDRLTPPLPLRGGGELTNLLTPGRVGAPRLPVDPNEEIARDPRSGVRRRRRRLHKDSVGRAVSAATKRSDLTQRATARTFRHGVAKRLTGAGDDIRTVRELLGRKDVRTTIASKHVQNRGGRGFVNPAHFDLPEADPVQDHVRTSSCAVTDKR